VRRALAAEEEVVDLGVVAPSLREADVEAVDGSRTLEPRDRLLPADVAQEDSVFTSLRAQANLSVASTCVERNHVEAVVLTECGRVTATELDTWTTIRSGQPEDLHLWGFPCHAHLPYADIDPIPDKRLCQHLNENQQTAAHDAVFCIQHTAPSRRRFLCLSRPRER